MLVYQRVGSLFFGLFMILWMVSEICLSISLNCSTPKPFFVDYDDPLFTRVAGYIMGLVYRGGS